MSARKETSRTLLHRVRDARDHEAWRRFLEIYAPLLESYGRAHGLSASDVEEVRDQCLELVARRMPGFEYERARGGFKGWLYRIAKGRIVDMLRRPVPRRAETRELVALSAALPAPDELWEEHWRAEHLRYALERVKEREPPRSFAVFELLLFDGLDVAEVCARTGLNANQVYKAKSRVLRRLRRTLERSDAEPGLRGA